MSISFHAEGVDFNIEDQEQERIRDWIVKTLEQENPVEISEISIIFCSDDYLMDINREYLDHHYYTDIITFPYNADPLSADLFISIDRVGDNANQMGVPFMEELRRVIIHGILHLCGYEDDTEASKEEMRKRENEYLKFWDSRQG